MERDVCKVLSETCVMYVKETYVMNWTRDEIERDLCNVCKRDVYNALNETYKMYVKKTYVMYWTRDES